MKVHFADDSNCQTSHGSILSSSYYIEPKDGILNNESDRMWKKAVVISFKGVTEFSETEYITKKFQKIPRLPQRKSQQRSSTSFPIHY
jgi:hypothetical protein